MTALLFGGLGFTHVEAAEDVPLSIIKEGEISDEGMKTPPLIISQDGNVPLGRICNPIASNISICNA